ncbi:MAG: guanylate kinase [Actinomycetota bacterium]
MIVIAGPSGVGKGSVVKALRARDPDGLWLSVSATTRPPRSGEVPGLDYVFVDDAEFSRMVEAGELLEWAEVFGNRYGTPRAYVDAELDAGHDVILEIDVQGAQQVRDQAPDALLILLEPPTLEELASRLRGRGTESEERIATRLEKADWELAQRGSFDHVVVNDDLEHASSQVAAIIEGSRAESSADGRDPTEDRSG